MSKAVVWVIALCIMLLLGWAIKSYYYSEVPPQEFPGTKPVIVLPAPANNLNNIQEPKPAAPSSKGEVFEGESLGSQRISTNKPVITNDKPSNLSEHTMTIKREKKPGYEIMPGVNVKRGGVNIKLDQENTRSVEIERSPNNSNSQYQLLLKQKF